MPRTVLITGCTSGIGKAAAELFFAEGWNVAAAMLEPSCPSGIALGALPNVIVPPLDVTDRDAADAAVSATLAEFGSLDVVVNNPGGCLTAPADFPTKTNVLSQLTKNVYGPLAVVQAALPHFRSRRSGIVVNVGSVIHKAPFPFMPACVASKCALDGMTDALNLELVPLGIRAKIVHPGVTASDMRSDLVDQAYSDLRACTNSAQHIASVLYQAATDGSERVRYPAGKDCLQFLSERNEKSHDEWEKEWLNFKMT